MLTLWSRFNYRIVELGRDAFGDRVKVLEADGRTWLAQWQGFLGAEAAKRLEGARSVRLVIQRIESENGKGRGIGRRPLENGEYVQGCCVEDLVWAIVDQRVRIVTDLVRETGI